MSTAHELARCDREVSEAKRLLFEGHPEIEGLVLAISDWEREKQAILESERKINQPSFT